MQLILGLDSKQRLPRGCVATIGNFDGVHMGHRAIIDRLAGLGQALHLPVCVVLFEPQPLEFFDPDHAPPRLMRLREKVDRLSELPVDYALILRFNPSLSAMTPEAFIQRILIECLGVRHLVVGDDFRFGRGRSGNFAHLQQAGERLGFRVSDTPTVLINETRISSTWIRERLLEGDLDLAAHLLGRPYEICGRVIHGQKRGRTIGFPTANLLMQRKNTPVKGVFAVTMRGLGQNPWPGVANVGIRPTVTGNPTMLLETHLLNYKGDLYGKRVQVEFHQKLRDEKRFAGLEELRDQIERDIEAAERYFAAR